MGDEIIDEMITLYLDSTDANQVMAYYKGCRPGDPTVWTDQGFVEVQVADEHPSYNELGQLQRDCRFNDDVITHRVNPIQPIPRPRTRLDDLRDKLADDTINPAEIREMLRLERGL